MERLKLSLTGLDCAHCAGKIEKLVAELPEVKDSTLNFAFKLLIVDYNGLDEIAMMEKIKAIVNKLEPGVKVEKYSLTNKKKENNKEIKKLKLSLTGLDCAHCAGKIESLVAEFPEIKNCTLNFSFKLLMVDYSSLDEAEMIKKIKAVVNKLEPGVKVEKYSITSNNGTRGTCSDGCCDGHEHEEKEEKKENKKENSFINKILENIQLIIGIFIYVVGIVLGEKSGISVYFFIIAYLLVGYKVLFTAFKNLTKGNFFDENFLMAIATLGALAIKEYPEAVAVMIFYGIGEMFQSYAVNKSRKSISELMDIKAEYANLYNEGKIKRVSPEEVGIDEIILIKPGERVPLDGIIIDGNTTIDTSALTGESVPVEKENGQEILGGSINITGTIKVKVTSEFEQSTVARILELVQNASSKKAKTEKFITKFSRYYTPVVVLGAIILAVVPTLVIPGAEFKVWLSRALIFLVVSCPCALVVSVPLGLFAGIGSASKNGILVKGGNYLEILKNIDGVVFDKTGTLTEGVFKVNKIESFNGMEKSDVLKYAAACEKFSNHPIAKSILDEFEISNQGDIDNIEVKDHKEISGKGISGKIDGNKVLVGNYKLMEEENINVNEIESIGTIVYLAINGEFKGYITIADKIKADSKEAIRALKEIGIKKVIMLTGDNKKVGEAVGQELGLDKVYAELLPENKVEKLEELMESGEVSKVAFIGDGINDAPVLARADLGVAMGGIGSDAAIEAADVVLMKDNPLALRDAIKIARKTNKILWQNIIFSLGIKFLVLLMAVFGIANMWEAVFADVGVTVIAVINSMRALK
ncbi:heavy metal translocating P-type ATPase [uncultured Clostridium sp.]|uniref:heavy metal translocating P-type ATPase n=1 Tax=uncultured Clostridium sp. TaxID=59620 RepID=UPI0026043BDB|nr:heavy metal translocating P-type ATPase [uncultured Clostridium sp.]